MGLITAAIIAGGAVIAGSAIAANGAKSAAGAQEQASQNATQEQQREFDITQQNEAPYISVGQQAINRLGSIYGYSTPTNATPSSGAPVTAGAPAAPASGRFVPTPGNAMTGTTNYGLGSVGSGTPGYDPSSGYQIQPNGSVNQLIAGGTAQTGSAPTSASPATAPDYSSFYESPDYQFTKDQGTQGIENSFSASGGAKSGNALKALADFNSNLAAGQYGNYFNRQAALAGIGQTATGTQAAAGVATGAQVGNSLMAGGDARASGIVGQTNAFTGGLSGAAGALGYYTQNQGNYGNGYTVSGGVGMNPSGAAAAGDYADWSDRRLKQDIKRVGKTDAGLPLYRYRMKGSKVAKIGVMADEAQQKFPGAVKTDPSGFKKVNYMGIR